MSAFDRIREKLRGYPTAVTEVEGPTLRVLPASPDGFKVSFTEGDGEYIVGYEGWHEHFTTEEEALGCFAFGLSDRCRLRIEYKGAYPHRWTVEGKTSSGWKEDSSTGLFFFPSGGSSAYSTARTPLFQPPNDELHADAERSRFREALKYLPRPARVNLGREAHSTLPRLALLVRGPKMAFQSHTPGYRSMQSPLQLALRGTVTAAVLGSLAACGETPTESPPPETDRIVAVRSELNDYGSTELYVLDADGTNLVPLTEGMSATDPAWSPDGRRIAFLSWVWDYPGLYVVNADGTNLQRIWNESNSLSSPAWSPDGTRIAVSGIIAGVGGIHVMRADGTELRLLRKCSCYSLAWSPDGLRIAFVHRDLEGRGNDTIYVMRADGTEPAALRTGFYQSVDPAWSPDGGWIAFSGRRDANYLEDAIYMMRPDGTELRKITGRPRHEDRSPSFSPDGSRLVFVSRDRSRTILNQLYEVSIERQEERIQITTSPGSYSYASPRWRP